MVLVHRFVSLPILHAAANPSRGNRPPDLLHHPLLLCSENCTSFLTLSNSQFFAVATVWAHSFGISLGRAVLFIFPVWIRTQCSTFRFLCWEPHIEAVL